ncbi:MAG: hypothetical protein EOP84_06265 [Verrucomicrobiaceae bacterium]|nr:MAG: hypothetical protein EOP84_06265 [Verrucomicrobiaceae bacterium]
MLYNVSVLGENPFPFPPPKRGRRYLRIELAAHPQIGDLIEIDHKYLKGRFSVSSINNPGSGASHGSGHYGLFLHRDDGAISELRPTQRAT